MTLVIQRVSKASVRVQGQEIARILKGFLILVGVRQGDSDAVVENLVRKVSQLRVFGDEQGKMNLSIQDVRGEVLVVSQFTLAADLTRGNRPSFDQAEKPEQAQRLISLLVEGLKRQGLEVREGRFGAFMEVSLVNDGPVTFLMET